MANGVWHSGLKRVLELDKEDLGLGAAATGLSVPDLIEELLRPMAERDRDLLLCVEVSQRRPCKAELNGVKSPYMYVRKYRGPDGALRLRAAHLPTTYEMTAEESDRHKAMKDFLARTAQAAGLEVHVEKTTKARSSRPDVTIIGSGGLNLGCEAQYYNASAGSVLRRSKAHAEAGLTANWITHDDRFHLIDRANWMLTNEVTWREISNAADLPLVGGYRVLAEWLCTASAERPCPDDELKMKTGCGKVHLQWDTPRRLDDEGTGWTGYEGSRRGVTVGRTLIGVATGSVAPLFVRSRKNRRSGRHLWVPVEDLQKWAEYRGVETASFEESDALDEELQFSGKDADTTCKFGEASWSPSARLTKRGIDSVELAITIDRPKRAVMAESAASSRTTPELLHHSPPPAAPSVSVSAASPSGPLPAQPAAPDAEADASCVPAPVQPLAASRDPRTPDPTGLPAELIELQHAADMAHVALQQLTSLEDRQRQRRSWFEAACAIQAAVTQYARAKDLNRFEVERALRGVVRADNH